MYRVRDYLETDELDIFLTHAHLDHVVGLTYMFDVTHGREMQRVTVHAEQAKLDAVRTHLFSEYLFPVEPPFTTQTLQQDIKIAGNGTLSHFPLKHPGGSVGFRLSWPTGSMAYVTDTVAEKHADYVEHIRGVDLLVHECYFGDDMPEQAELTGHSCLTPVVEVAAAAEVGRLVLVHINPLDEDDSELDIDAARKIFPKTEIGVDRMELEF
jgi:ribonuclease BN (tRNA processing enzyme)